MRAIVVYESMYGNTRLIAEAIGAGLGVTAEAVMAVGEVTPGALEGADLVVVGGPTHMLGMSRPGTRRMAVDAARKPRSGVTVEPGADGPGLREWLGSVVGGRRRAAAFDTRYRAKFGGRASKRIGRLLTGHGFDVVAGPVSFFVTKANRLEDGEADRAREWGRRLATPGPTAPKADHLDGAA